MYIIVILLLVLTVFYLLYLIKEKSKTVITLKEELQNKNRRDQALKDQVLSYKDLAEQVRSSLDTIDLKYKDYISLFANSNRKVFANSNFYSAYSVYNNRFYAKVNNKLTNNKVEGIPVLDMPNNKNTVIDLYKLLYTIKNNPYLDMEILIKNSTVLKEDLILNLANKNLKPYKR
jgi:hypothetical protein